MFMKNSIVSGVEDMNIHIMSILHSHGIYRN